MSTTDTDLFQNTIPSAEDALYLEKKDSSVDICCGNCKYGRVLNSWDCVCRRYPPAPQTTNSTDGTSVVWPRTIFTDWCGEHVLSSNTE